MGCNVGQKGKGKEWTNEFGQCGATQPSDEGATNKTPSNYEVYQHSKPQKYNEHTPNESYIK